MTVLYLDLLGKGASGGNAALAFPHPKKRKVSFRMDPPTGGEMRNLPQSSNEQPVTGLILHSELGCNWIVIGILYF